MAAGDLLSGIRKQSKGGSRREEGGPQGPQEEHILWRAAEASGVSSPLVKGSLNCDRCTLAGRDSVKDGLVSVVGFQLPPALRVLPSERQGRMSKPCVSAPVWVQADSRARVGLGPTYRIQQPCRARGSPLSTTPLATMEGKHQDSVGM